ncbi:MAG: L-histidine N(alpha)-methyltransferase [Reinekea sp.]
MTNLNLKRQHNVNCNDQFLTDILNGLAAPQKTLPCKYFYDERGSQLFDEICNTPEYYHTRAELSIFDEALPVVSSLIGPNADILEFGSGVGIKILRLLDSLETPRSYTPIDISEEVLMNSALELHRRYDDLQVHPIVADYLSPIELPEMFIDDGPHKKLVFFPGSTISNFEPNEAISFLKHIRSLLNKGDGLLIGVDLIKPLPTLIPAYNDTQGVTAAFNKNLLTRIINTYDTDLDDSTFVHHALYNAEKHRIEMHLVSLKAQTVTIEGQSFSFKERESIHTENSYKFSIEGFRLMAQNAGFNSTVCFTDDINLFAVHFFTAG